jgi:multicomponent Na+:H+ antiporter subunit E
VEYTVRSVLEDATGADPATIVFAYLHSPDETMGRPEPEPDSDPDTVQADAEDVPEGVELLDRTSVWVDEDAGDKRDAILVETVRLGDDEFLFSPEDVADTIHTFVRDRGIDRLVLDPDYDPGVGAPLLRPLEYELSRLTDLEVEVPPVQSAVRRSPLLGRISGWRLFALFGTSMLFYTLLAGAFTAFDLVTGLVSATIVTIVLARISIGRDPSLRHSPLRLARGLLYLPYLLFEIVKANVAVALVILHPRLPIDPRTTRIEPAVYGSFPITSLANSITLTPGTLTVRVQGRSLLVHTLVPSARQDLFDGGLERAIRFVFYGRSAMRIPGLADRGAAEIVDDPTGTAESQPPDDDTTGGEAA